MGLTTATDTTATDTTTPVKLRISDDKDAIQGTGSTKYVPLKKYYDLNQRYQSVKKKCDYLQNTYEKYSEQVIERSQKVDLLKTELIDKNALLSKQKAKLNELEERYAELLQTSSELESRMNQFAKNSWLISQIDSFHQRLYKEVEFGFVNKLMAFFSRFSRAKARIEDETKEHVDSSDQIETTWFSIKRAIPVITGMYRVSDGESEAYAYYDAETHTFSNKDFATRYWQVAG